MHSEYWLRQVFTIWTCLFLKKNWFGILFVKYTYVGSCHFCVWLVCGRYLPWVACRYFAVYLHVWLSLGQAFNKDLLRDMFKRWLVVQEVSVHTWRYIFISGERRVSGVSETSSRFELEIKVFSIAWLLFTATGIHNYGSISLAWQLDLLWCSESLFAAISDIVCAHCHVKVLFGSSHTIVCSCISYRITVRILLPSCTIKFCIIPCIAWSTCHWHEGNLFHWFLLIIVSCLHATFYDRWSSAFSLRMLL